MIPRHVFVKRKRLFIIAALLAGISLAVQFPQPAQAVPPGATDAERDSLIALYNVLNGHAWTNNTNWLDPDPCDDATPWYGLTCHPLYGGVVGVDLHSNNVEGNIGAVDLRELNSLILLSLDSNQIGGNIEDFDLSHNPAMQFLYLSNNQIGGNIGGFDPGYLENLDLSNNQIGGVIDGFDVTQDQRLHDLILHSNQIGGNIDDFDLDNNIALYELDLSNNQIGGNIDGLWLGNTYVLHELDLSNNQIEGNIDGFWLGYKQWLWRVDLSNNQIRGVIDYYCCGHVVDLSNNQIGGIINTFNFDYLESVNLSNNQIGGEIDGLFDNRPYEISSLLLTNNQISGPLPWWMSPTWSPDLVELDLSNNLCLRYGGLGDEGFVTSLDPDWLTSNTDPSCAAGVGTIEIIKVTVPAGGVGFGFADADEPAPDLPIPHFTLDHGELQTFDNFPSPGSYRVQEEDPTPDYLLTGLTCTDSYAEGEASTGSLEDRTADINLEAGETVTCTFTNEAPNEPPDCANAVPSIDSLWPPQHQFVAIDVLGVTDPEDDPIMITIDSIFQDEAVDAPDSGHTSPDGQGVGTSTAEVRAERVGTANGRVYHIGFTADDGRGGTCSSEVLVGVPTSRGPHDAPVDDGSLYDSTMAVP